MSQQESKIGPLLQSINSNMGRSDVTFKREGARGTAIVLSVLLPVKTAGKGLSDLLCHDFCCTDDGF